MGEEWALSSTLTGSPEKMFCYRCGVVRLVAGVAIGLMCERCGTPILLRATNGPRPLVRQIADRPTNRVMDRGRDTTSSARLFIYRYITFESFGTKIESQFQAD